MESTKTPAKRWNYRLAKYILQKSSNRDWITPHDKRIAGWSEIFMKILVNGHGVQQTSRVVKSTTADILDLGGVTRAFN
ncbi:hypothetical protein KIN20_019911 [Parelaphostrongylus tenuis]|uniref:Uncharacterized protein n=1 Tax=Parelaphostrongylus tenuis TaxID=148309 RepID=A0AAD5MLU6_PARTN|nr:hypothetical protein KIN20_019911 [Parelaphostrongylus tenuis]